LPCVQVTVLQREPAIVVSDVAIVEATYYEGDRVQVSATFVNNGDGAGTADIEVTVDGQLQVPDVITLEPGESKTVTYVTAPLPAGTHNICVEIVEQTPV